MQNNFPAYRKILLFLFIFNKSLTNTFLLAEKKKTVGKKKRGGEHSGLLARLQLGHFLHVDADALTVKQHKVDGLDGGRHGGHKVAGDGLQDQLGCRLLRETVPDRRTQAW